MLSGGMGNVVAVMLAFAGGVAGGHGVAIGPEQQPFQRRWRFTPCGCRPLVLVGCQYGVGLLPNWLFNYGIMLPLI